MLDGDALREHLSLLRGQVHDEDTLVGLLALPLELLGLVAPTVNEPERSERRKISKFIRDYQGCLVQNVLPHWQERLAELEKVSLIKAYFIPTIPLKTWTQKELLLSSYQSLIVSPISQLSVDILRELCCAFTPLDAFTHIFRDDSYDKIQEPLQRWNDFINVLFSVPGRLMNAAEDAKLDIPEQLVPHEFSSALCRSFYQLLQSAHIRPDKDPHLEASAFMLGRLVSFGCFPLPLSDLPTVISFWKQALLIPVSELASATVEDTRRRHFLTSVLTLVPLAQQITVLQSLFTHLDLFKHDSLNISMVGVESALTHRLAIKQAALRLSNMIGWPIEISSDSIEAMRVHLDDVLWQLTSTILDRPITEGLARVIPCWSSLAPSREEVLRKLLDRAVELWSNEVHIKHSTLSRHKAITCLLLTTLAEMHLNSSKSELHNTAFKRLSTLPVFINAVGFYIGHPDPSVRRCGLLVAEIVAQKSGGKLQFSDWDGAGEGREWARAMRTLASGRDSDVEIPKTIEGSPSPAQNDQVTVPPLTRPSNPHTITIVDQAENSDDSLEGYASSEASSRPTTPKLTVQTSMKGSELKSASREPTVEEVNADPTLLNPTKKRIRKPVYLFDLGNLFKVSQEGEEQAESIRIGLESAAALIRRKARWGFELEENAVDLAYVIMGLQNNYELEDFERSTLEALTALVACCPKKSAPCIIEHFFTPSFSVGQRFRMLNALALGARELAGLPTPQIAAHAPAFPSRLLTASAHKKYLTSEDMGQVSAQVQGLVEGISAEAIESGRKNAEKHVPEIVRERQLTFMGNRSKKAGIVELGPSKLPKEVRDANVKAGPSFTEVAAEFFISPLLSRFWVYLQDSFAYEDAQRRTRSGGGFRAAGTGMILNPLVLAHLINTIAVLAHAARNSLAYLSVIAPATLELAVTVGTRRMSTEQNSTSINLSDEETRRDASVLCSALELAIVVVDGCIDVDGGKTVASENGTLITGASVWANKSFETVHKGLKLEGMGGEMERRLSKASAGLVIKLEEVAARWHPIPLLPM